MLPINKMVKAFREGRPSFGIYMKTPSEKMVEMLGFAGLDFVRIDLNSGFFNTERVESMIRTAHAVGVTPAIRVERNDPLLIQAALRMGALHIIIPEVATVSEVKEAVTAAKLPPVGVRHAGPTTFIGGYGTVSMDTYREWANENLTISAQIERKSSVDAIDEIVKIEGLDMVQSGRGTLSYDYGVKSQYEPVIIEAEAKVIAAGQAAGKMTSVQYYPLKDVRQCEWIRGFIKEGVSCLCLGTDIDIVDVFRRLLSDLKA